MARNTQSSRARSQRGGTFLGLVLGLIVGLAIAVVVAVYITKAPVPFVSAGLPGNAHRRPAGRRAT